MPDDLLRCADQWDGQLADAYPFFDKVAQPLASLIRTDHLFKVNQVARGDAAPDSIRICFFNPANPSEARSHA
jgi:hypothetical protein